MNEKNSLHNKEVAGQKLNLGLQSRLLYLMLKCPLLQRECGKCAATAATGKSGQRREYADDERVVIYVTIPYALRRQARAAHLDCNELTRKALTRQLKKAARK